MRQVILFVLILVANISLGRDVPNQNVSDLNSVSEQEISNIGGFDEKYYDSENLVRLLEYTRSEIANRFSKEYRVVECGPDASYEGYYFEKLGITIVYSLSDTPIYLELSNVDGVVLGMQLEQAREILGVSEIVHVHYDSENGFPEIDEYEVNYNVEGLLLRLISFEGLYVDEVILYDKEYSDYYFSTENKN